MKKIKHPGTIVNMGNNVATVEIISHSACATCKSKAMCQMSESKEKLVDVAIADAASYSVGQEVNIVMQEALGLKAVFWAYVMPFLVCVVALFGLSLVSESEWVYGGGGLLAAALYFVGLMRFSERLGRVFVWYLE